MLFPLLLCFRLISTFLPVGDIVRLAQTCRDLASATPPVLARTLPDLRESGPDEGHWAPVLWKVFPPLAGKVSRIEPKLSSRCFR